MSHDLFFGPKSEVVRQKRREKTQKKRRNGDYSAIASAVAEPVVAASVSANVRRIHAIASFGQTCTHGSMPLTPCHAVSAVPSDRPWPPLGNRCASTLTPAFLQASTSISVFSYGTQSSGTVCQTNTGGVFASICRSMDTASNATRYTVVANIMESVPQRDYSVVLQHDTNDFSVDAVEDILSWGIQNGYSFRAIDLTTPAVHHGVAN